jgi:hypothetical protein
MLALPRVLVWVGAMALAIFVFLIYNAVRTLQTMVQGHTATLDKPVIETTVFPGVPAAFAGSWKTVTYVDAPGGCTHPGASDFNGTTGPS